MKKALKSKSGITLVSLVVTIIILIILAGISINMTIGNNGIITIAKKAKENTELARIEEETKLNELYEHISLEGGEPGDISYDSIVKLNDFKKKITDYIEEAGGIKPEYTASIEIFGDRIKGIIKEVTKDATATPEDIQEGKTAWVNGELITGNHTSSPSITLYQLKQNGGGNIVADEDGMYLVISIGPYMDSVIFQKGVHSDVTIDIKYRTNLAYYNSGDKICSSHGYIGYAVYKLK